MNVIKQTKRGGGGNPGGGARPLMAPGKPKGRGRGALDFDLIQYRPCQRAGTSTSSSGEARTPSNLHLQMAISSSPAHRTSTSSGNNYYTPSAGRAQHGRHPGQSSSSLSGRNTELPAATPLFATMGPPKTPRSNLCTPRTSMIVSSTPRTTPTSTSTGCDAHRSHVVLAVTEGRGHARGEVGLAVIDVKRPRLILCQLSDRQTYTNTVTKINVFQPAEILVPHTFVDSNQTNKLYQLLEEKFPFVSMTKVQRRLFRDSEGLEKVQYLCIPENSSCQLILQEKFYALAAAAALLKYVEFVQNVIFAAHSLKVEYQGAHHGTIIDVKTAKNLELLLNQQSNSATHTLVSVMDHCCTHGGSRLLRASLLHPPCSLPTITRRQDGVQELVENPDIAQKIREVLQQLPDVEQLLTLCMQTPSTIDTTQAMETRVNYILMLKTTVEALPLLVAALEKAQSFLLSKARECLLDPRSELIKKRIVQTLNEDVKAPKGGKTAVFQRCFAVKSGINDLMDVARKTYCELINDMHEHVLELGSTHALLLKMNYSVTKGYHIQIPIQKGHAIKKSDLPSLFVQVQESRNSLSCTTDTLIHANERIKYVTTDILTMSNTLLTVILNDIREHISYLYEMCESIAEVDLILALAQTSRSHNYVRPKFGLNLSLKSSRHPILESITTCDPIANDIEATSCQNLSIITGPNMSGKSIYIRQVLLLQIMSQVGCYVPAEEASFRITDRIFSHLNFDDSIENNASTLSLEMQEMQLILSSITPTSLVALDELCRGTSVEEGTAIAWALCEEMSQCTAFVFVTTHFRELTRLSSLYPCIKNVHLETVEHEFSDKKCRLVYTHRLMPGINPVEDYGLRLAENLNVSASILQTTADFASQIRSTSEVNLTSAQGDENYTLAMAFHKLKLMALKNNLSVSNLQALQSEMREALKVAQQQSTSTTVNETKANVSQNTLIETKSNAYDSQQKLCDYSSSDSEFLSQTDHEVSRRRMYRSESSHGPTQTNKDLSPVIDDCSSGLSPCHDLQSRSMSQVSSPVVNDDNLMSTSTSILDSSFDGSLSFCSQHTWLAESPFNRSIENRMNSTRQFSPDKRMLTESPLDLPSQSRNESERQLPSHQRMFAESPLDPSILSRNNSDGQFLSGNRRRNYCDSSDSQSDEGSMTKYFRADSDDDFSHSSHPSHQRAESIVGENINYKVPFSSFCVDATQKPLTNSMIDSSMDFFSLSTVVRSQNSVLSSPPNFSKQVISKGKTNIESLFKNEVAEEITEKTTKRQEAPTSAFEKKRLDKYGEASRACISEISHKTTPFKTSSLHLTFEHSDDIKGTPSKEFTTSIADATSLIPSIPVTPRNQVALGSLKSLIDSYCYSDSESD